MEFTLKSKRLRYQQVNQIVHQLTITRTSTLFGYAFVGIKSTCKKQKVGTKVFEDELQQDVVSLQLHRATKFRVNGCQTYAKCLVTCQRISAKERYMRVFIIFSISSIEDNRLLQVFRWISHHWKKNGSAQFVPEIHNKLRLPYPSKL